MTEEQSRRKRDAGQSDCLSFTINIWRQQGLNDKGHMVSYPLKRVRPEMSFLEMLDVLNGELERKGEELPISFDSDCREGICGMCGLVINGVAHGPGHGTTTCQLYMRSFADGATITIEPWRAAAFPVIKDLVVDRSAFDRIIQAGGYASVNSGSAPDANSMLVSQELASEAFDAAACIGCGACVASCKNASAMLFVSAKVKHLNILPQGQPERHKRTAAMVEAMQQEGFGNCTNEYECEAVCPKEIAVEHISFLNREYLKAKVAGK
ncbi:MAG TPA: succinate dehydrogenase/fumarate reductase iron-sulfur subunit [Candidatus Latescibacteria bacterium]|nr:succinate dehydrogenase/fumarate reductase iron-sulfur subunit [Candidatus Handelsmanbacteria bacterium]HIL10014.1 succinate dehydrogenase/fumarate reductase iron-sulfur subunit [Candidatus Latescibacterota bacterium]